jgi:hypothetical protein
MIVNEGELNDFYTKCWETEQEAAQLTAQANVMKTEVKDEIAGFAEAHEITPKVLNIGYDHFKKLKAGKIPITDASYFPIMTAVESMFSE